MNHEIYLRCHTRILDVAKRHRDQTGKLLTWPEYVLVLDTETTRDDRQNLNFGAYRFCKADAHGRYRCVEEGLFYADDVQASHIAILQAYVAASSASTADGYSRKLRLYSRSEFIEKVFYAAVQAGAAIVAFNLPFDLSRLAVEYRVARNAGGRGWSFILFRYYDRKKRKWLPNTFRPRIKLRPKDSKAAFIRLAGGDMHQPYRLGRFIDLKTLVWALRNKSLKLDTACRMFGVPGKMDHAPTGKVTPAEISYCREDVRATTELLNALRTEFDGYPVDLLPEKAYSAASIAKACLRTMGMTSPLEKFQLDDRLLGICMQAYYGGRAECRIRHTPVPVVYTDFTSQYPTVNTLLKLWPLLVAERLRVRNVEVGRLLSRLTLDQLLDQKIWPKLAFFALVQPDQDILPVRTVYGDTRGRDQTNIGLNPLTSAKPIWFAGPDLVTSMLLAGKVPKVLRH